MQFQRLFQHAVRDRPHLTVAIGLGLVVALCLPEGWRALTRALIAWNVAVWSYLASALWLVMHVRPAQVRGIARRLEDSAALVMTALLVAAAMSLTAIIFELSATRGGPPDERALRYGFTIVTLLGSWLLVGTVFCFHYAHLYYLADPACPPLQFPDHEAQPDYWDFLYVAFTIAVAAQTADVSMQTRAMRKLVLGQALLSFFFNLVILGLSINIAAGLING